MEPVEHRGRTFAKCALAVVLAAFYVGVVLPNAGRLVVDHTTTPPTLHVVGRARDTIMVISMAAIPLALVLTGTLLRSRLAVAGWILLALLVLTLFLK